MFITPKKLAKKIIRPKRSNYYEEFEMESKFEFDNPEIQRKDFRIIDSEINK